MEKYALIITLIGIAAFSMAWMPSLSKLTGISYAIIYVLTGVLIYVFHPSLLPDPNPEINETLTLHLTEMVVIISLMGTGIKIDRSFSFKNWSSPIRLVTVAMVLCIAGAALLGYTFLSFDLSSALLLGAVLAPTDPVLASDVQVGPPNSKRKTEAKFSLTAEAGLNDGMAFPFTWLAVVIALMAKGQDASLWNWVWNDLLYKLVAGIAIGILFGKTVGYLIFELSKKYSFLKTKDGFLALSLTFLVYGATEMVHAYGFIAVFICAITLRHSEKSADYHDDLHSFTDQIERFLVAILLILFGGSLVNGILDALTWKMVLFTILFIFFIRPGAAFLSLYKSKMHTKERLAISFFGIRGMGSIFYLAFAFSQTQFVFEKELWSMVAFTILVSVVIHGITASPIMKHLKNEIPHEEIPE
jgi:NhaP-type Na+/H+ or K+/H+ antiporter